MALSRYVCILPNIPWDCLAGTTTGYDKTPSRNQHYTSDSVNHTVIQSNILSEDNAVSLSVFTSIATTAWFKSPVQYGK